MSQSILKIPAAFRLPQLVGLISGDVLALLVFTWVGRDSHNLPGSDILGLLLTALPFGLAWFITAPWLGLFKADICLTWWQWLWRVPLAWLLAGPLGAFLRAWLIGRAVIPPTFVLVTIIFASLFVLVWRLGFGWWANRTLRQPL
jgi:hypothetical protein